MDTRTPLYRPEGFKDSDKWALGPNGELIEWKWNSLPGDFCVDERGVVFHNCPDRKTWSRIVRHGEEASNFFQEDINPLPKKVERAQDTTSFGKEGKKYSLSYKGKRHLRKKKFKKKKYKNSRLRQRRRSNRSGHKLTKSKKKNIQKSKKSMRSVNACAANSRDVCQLCLTSGERDNIFLDPQDKYSCDCCGKCFNGLQWEGCVCGSCLDRWYRMKFCDECSNNLGDWHRDWRMKFDIPQRHHPRHCECQECFQYRWLRPCCACGMTCHAAEGCPWSSDIAAATRYRRWEVEHGNHANRYYEEMYEMYDEDYWDDYMFML